VLTADAPRPAGRLGAPTHDFLVGLADAAAARWPQPEPAAAPAGHVLGRTGPCARARRPAQRRGPMPARDSAAAQRRRRDHLRLLRPRSPRASSCFPGSARLSPDSSPPGGRSDAARAGPSLTLPHCRGRGLLGAVLGTGLQGKVSPRVTPVVLEQTLPHHRSHIPAGLHSLHEPLRLVPHRPVLVPGVAPCSPIAAGLGVARHRRGGAPSTGVKLPGRHRPAPRIPMLDTTNGTASLKLTRSHAAGVPPPARNHCSLG